MNKTLFYFYSGRSIKNSPSHVCLPVSVLYTVSLKYDYRLLDVMKVMKAGNHLCFGVFLYHLFRSKTFIYVLSTTQRKETTNVTLRALRIVSFTSEPLRRNNLLHITHFKDNCNVRKKTDKFDNEKFHLL